MASAKMAADVTVEAGKVSEVRNQFLLQGDEGLANRLQDQEFGEKYKWNRSERQVARQDVPLAKVVHSEEEERMQKERYERLQEEKRRADEDALIARQLEREEQLRRDLERLQDDDVKLATEMQQEEINHMKRAEADAKIAMQLQKQELVNRRSERRQRELADQSLAQRLQERERRLTTLINAERELRRQHRAQQSAAETVAATGAGGRSAAVYDTRLDGGGNAHPQNALMTQGAMVIDDGEDETPGVDREELLYRQDRDMAKALQDLEIEQSRANKDEMYDIVGSDARLARIMQEQERLDALRRAEERRIRRAAREYHERMHRAAASRHPQCCGEGIEPPQYDPPPVPRYVDARSPALACPHHTCDCGFIDGMQQQPPPHERRRLQHCLSEPGHPRHACGCGACEVPRYANEPVGPDQSYRGGELVSNHRHAQQQHRATSTGSSALPPDFLRLESDVVSRPGGVVDRQNVPSGPVYIGPAGRSMSTREQRTDYSREAAGNPKHVGRSTSKGGNCKQQ